MKRPPICSERRHVFPVRRKREDFSFKICHNGRAWRGFPPSSFYRLALPSLHFLQAQFHSHIGEILQPAGGYAIINCASVQISFWVKRESGENPERSRRCKREMDPPRCHWAPKPGKAEDRIPREPEDLLAGIQNRSHVEMAARCMNCTTNSGRTGCFNATRTAFLIADLAAFRLHRRPKDAAVFRQSCRTGSHWLKSNIGFRWINTILKGCRTK